MHIAIACAVLHNIGKDRNDILDVDEEYINHGDMSFDVTDQRDGKNVRNNICKAFFYKHVKSVKW